MPILEAKSELYLLPNHQSHQCKNIVSAKSTIAVGKRENFHICNKFHVIAICNANSDVKILQ